MASLSFYMGDERTIAAPFDTATMKETARVEGSLNKALTSSAQEILAKGQADILAAGGGASAGGGSLGTIAQSLRVAVSQGGGNYRLSVSNTSPWFWVHERGALIKGNPLLWIALSFADVPKGVYARNYPGRLFRVDRLSGGAPLLWDAATKQPKYAGISQVTIKKSFHITEIIAQVASKIKDRYKEAFSASKDEDQGQ